MKKKRFAAIVLSAGTGSRMQSDIPKQQVFRVPKPVIGAICMERKHCYQKNHIEVA